MESSTAEFTIIVIREVALRRFHRVDELSVWWRRPLIPASAAGRMDICTARNLTSDQHEQLIKLVVAGGRDGSPT